MIKIDGSHGEGGGQIIRTALAFSTALQKPFEADSIRKGRKQPGLKAQHLTCLKALEQLCSSKFNEASIGTESLRYLPEKIKKRTIDIDIGTAGSITLLLQSLLVPCFFASHPVTLKIKGGTSGKWQMPFDYFNNVLIPHLRKYAEIKVSLNRRGYYPKGGGEIEIRITPKYSLETLNDAPQIDLSYQGKILQIKGISHASRDMQEKKVAERQADAARTNLSKLGCSIDIRTEYCNTLSTGSGITLWALFSKGEETNFVNPIIIGSDALGERGKSSEDVGIESADKLIEQISLGAPVDEYLADNLIPFLALFGGSMRVSKISEHTKSNMYVVESFLGKIFEINESEKIISVRSVKQV